MERHGLFQQRYEDHGRRLFLDAIVKDDRNSFYHIAFRKPAGKGAPAWIETSRSAKYLAEFDFDDTLDCFVTHNGFASKLSRTGGMCRQLNSFLFDVDVHGCQDPDYHLELAFQVLQGAWERGSIPEPTMVVHTGRGLHLHYVMERSTAVKKAGGAPNRAGTAYFEDVQEKLACAISKQIACVPEAKLDRAVFDRSRVCRVPGTINSKAGRLCELVVYTGAFHSLKAINECLPAAEKGRARRGIGMKRKAGNYSHLAEIRLDRIRKLQEHRGFDSKGTRELMCFCFYNAAVQHYASRSDALAALEQFNARFIEPIPESEIKSIRGSVDKRCFYRISSKKIAAFLALTDAEAAETGFYMTKRDIDRERARERTAKARSRRDARAMFLVRATDLKCRDVAEALGCSERTVYSIKARSGDAPASMDLAEATRLLLDYASHGKARGITTQTKSAASFLQRGCAREAVPARREPLTRSRFDPGGT